MRDDNNILIGVVESNQELVAHEESEQELVALLEIGTGGIPASSVIAVFILDQEEYDALQEHPSDTWYVIKG